MALIVLVILAALLALVLVAAVRPTQKAPALLRIEPTTRRRPRQ